MAVIPVEEQQQELQHRSAGDPAEDTVEGGFLLTFFGRLQLLCVLVHLHISCDILCEGKMFLIYFSRKHVLLQP